MLTLDDVHAAADLAFEATEGLMSFTDFIRKFDGFENLHILTIAKLYSQRSEFLNDRPNPEYKKDIVRFISYTT